MRRMALDLGEDGQTFLFGDRTASEHERRRHPHLPTTLPA